MEDEVGIETLKKIVNMGADSNCSANSRLITLQNRKQVLEENIALKNRELRALCIQEAELTGVIPPEVPLEPGESLPPCRRRVGTAFEYPQNLLNKLNSEEESIAALETGIQFQKRILEDALRLVNDATFTKEKRKNMIIYEQTKQQLKDMEEKLEHLKSQTYGSQQSASQNQHLKQKKKPRPPLKSDSNTLKNNNVTTAHIEVMNTGNILHHTLPHRTEANHLTIELETDRHITTRSHIIYRNTDSCAPERELYRNSNYTRPDDGLVSTLNRLSVNSYGGVKDRRGSGSSNNSTYIPPNSYTHSHSNPNIYQYQSSHTLPPPHTHTLPSTSHMVSPTSQYQGPMTASHPSLSYPMHPHTLQHSPSRLRTYKEDTRKYSMENYNRNGYPPDQHGGYNAHHTLNIHTSPQNHKLYAIDPSNFTNMIHPHSIPLYQHNEPEMLSAGLGGHWLKHENGESVWVPSHLDTPVSWSTDKRFGSLDRRKEKYINSKLSPIPLDTVGKGSTLRSLVNVQQEPIRIATLPPTVNTIRSSTRHDNRQLVRTQSLGSVGAQTVDSVWPSDDNSSYDSDGYSINEKTAISRKSKSKGWCETSLDSPADQNLNLMNTGLLEEEPLSPSLSTPSRASISSPQTPKSVFEIPAESNPSPMHPETNIELFNNNVLTDLPKNCTVVQAGQFKPYREETKPFEMEDFYKYSTKFRERKQDKMAGKSGLLDSPKKQDHHFTVGNDLCQIQNNSIQESCEGSVDEVDSSGVVHKGIYQPLQPMKCQPFSPPNFNRSFAGIATPGSENTNLDSSLALTTANVAEHFSAEMNAWYQSHGQDNNNTTNTSSVSRSTATLV